MTSYKTDAGSAELLALCGGTVSEAYSIPPAVDLFTRLGAKDGARAASELRSAGYGAAALAPEREIADGFALKTARLTASERGALTPLPSALKDDGTMAEIGLMSRGGEKLFCVPEGFEDVRRLRNLFCYASDFGCRVAVSPSLKALCEKGQINEGAASSRLGIRGVPASAEVIAVQASLTLAAEWKTPLHLRGLSCRASLAAVAGAKAAGQDVTCDTAIANLIFDESVYTEETLTGEFKLWPVLRGAGDRSALWAALDSGLIDAVVTNHRARSADELALPFEEIPFGSERLPTALSDLLNAWESLGRPCAPEKLFAALSSGPRRISGLDAPGKTLLCRCETGWRAFYKDE